MGDNDNTELRYIWQWLHWSGVWILVTTIALSWNTHWWHWLHYLLVAMFTLTDNWEWWPHVMIIEESQWGHRQWQLMRVRLFRETCLVIITEQCEACSIQQLNNAFVQLFYHWTIWSIFGTSMDDNDTDEETRVVVHINCWLLLNHVKLVQFNNWTMWSLFNCSIIGQFEVDSVPNIFNCTLHSAWIALVVLAQWP